MLHHQQPGLKTLVRCEEGPVAFEQVLEYVVSNNQASQKFFPKTINSLEWGL
jgi:hypothetical protein